MMAGVHGLEPRYRESKSRVLPLDDTPTFTGGDYWIRTNDQSFSPDAFLAGRCLRPTRPSLHKLVGQHGLEPWT